MKEGFFAVATGLSELKLNLACTLALGLAHNDRDIMAELGNKFKQLCFADSTELTTSDLGDLRLVNAQQLRCCILSQMPGLDAASDFCRQGC